MKLALRPYQQDAINATMDWFTKNQGNCLIVLPTGTGKALLCAELARLVCCYPGTRVLVVTHVRELVAQNHAEMLALWPEAPAGIYSASLNRRDTGARITFCSIQSVFRRWDKIPRPDIIIVDEAHLIPRKAETMYGKFLSSMKLVNPHVRVIGLTATPHRMDSGRLDQGDDRIFHGISYEYGIAQAIADGYLAPLVAKDPKLHLDTDGVGTRGGEFIASELQAAVDQDRLNTAAVDEAIAYGRDRRSWLFFCSGIEHAEHISELLNARGVSCRAISSDTASDERDRVIADFKAGRLRALCSMNILCLSEDTEILTSSGFVGIDEMSSDHLIAAWKIDGSIEYTPPELIVRRYASAGERFVCSSGRGANIRVTENHRMVVRCGKSLNSIKVVPAADLVGKKVTIPAFGSAIPDAAVVGTPEYSQSYSQHVRVTSHHMRKRGMDWEEAHAAAVEQVLRLRAMKYKAPSDLTHDECALIGFWLGDGTKSNGRVSLSQSMAYPDNVAWIDEILTKTGIHHTRHIKAPAKNTKNNSVCWTLARGTGGFGQAVDVGYFHIEPYLDKSGSELLRGLTRQQLLSLLNGFWLADGTHHTKAHTHKRIVGTQKPLYNLLQEICSSRGISATVTGPIKMKNPKHLDQWIFCWGSRDNWSVQDFHFEEPRAGERVWCVTSSTSFLICRRDGKVFVTGNTTGFNAPAVDLIAMLRPTKSASLYIQMAGRGTRVAPGKRNCLVLDFAGNVTRFGPIDAVNVKEPGEGGGDAPIRICPCCQTILHASARVCSECSYEFPAPAPKIEATATTAPLLSFDVKDAEWVPVESVGYGRHEKPGKTPSMRVRYYEENAFVDYSEWICFEHPAGSFPRKKAGTWWLARGGALPVPSSVDEALGRRNELRLATEVLVKKNGKYWEVLAHRQGPVRDVPSGGAASRLLAVAGAEARP